MPDVRESSSAQVDNKTFSKDIANTRDGSVLKDPSLAAAQVGELTTRTSDTVGTLTMDDAGHGITTASIITIFWTTAAGLYQKRYNVTVGTVAGVSVPFSVGSGDNLPPLNSEVQAMVGQMEDFVATAANVQFIGARIDGSIQGLAEFLTAADALVVAAHTTPEGDYWWSITSGIASPVGSNVAKVRLSHSDTTQSRKVTALAVIT